VGDPATPVSFQKAYGERTARPVGSKKKKKEIQNQKYSDIVSNEKQTATVSDIP